MTTVTSWETLRILGKSKVVGLTAVVPFIGYLILFNESLMPYISIAHEIVGPDQAKSFSISRLYYLYFGFSFLGLASIFFSILCPKEIKDNSSEYEYISKEMNIMTHSRLKGIVSQYESILGEKDKLYLELETHLNTYKTADLEVSKYLPLENPMRAAYAKETESSAQRDILKFDWNFKNQLHKFIRIVIVFFYAIGFTLVAIPSVSVATKIILSLVVKI